MSHLLSSVCLQLLQSGTCAHTHTRTRKRRDASDLELVSLPSSRPPMCVSADSESLALFPVGVRLLAAGLLRPLVPE